MQRRTFVKNVGIATSAMAMSNLYGSTRFWDEEGFPLMDLHVHNTTEFTIEKAMEIAKARKVKFGIVEHPAEWALKDDADLKKYIDNLKNYPVYIGLQPMTTRWIGNYSRDLIRQLDYILMDPQVIPLENGEYEMIYKLETYVEDIEAFMDRYMKHTLNILATEPMNILGWPLFLPVCIAKHYFEIWTDERMDLIISAAKARDIAIEINDMSQTPHEKFILMAKDRGLKFTFGSDSRNPNAGRLAYCKAVAKRCQLKKEDFYIPNGVRDY